LTDLSGPVPGAFGNQHAKNSGQKILTEFENNQLDFKNHIEELQTFFTRETFIKYPGETELIFRLEDCIEFLILHENRHWVQAEEVKKNLIESK
jgi:hypothetical protein